MSKPIYATWMLSNNIGDKLTPWLIRKITGQTPFYVPLTHPFPKYMVTGSILNHAMAYTTVWGAGIANQDDIVYKHADIRLVRGVMTAQRLRFQAGIDIVKCGDPALLLPRFYNPEVRKFYKVGICPHYLHQKEFAEWIGDRTDFKFINVFDCVEKFVDDIKSCEMVLSSSLHGLIIADAYKVASKWIKGTEQLGGDSTKFMDHLILKLSLIMSDQDKSMETLDDLVINTLDPRIFERVGLCNHLFQLPKDANKILEAFPLPVPGEKSLNYLQDRIWDTCPFKEVALKEVSDYMEASRLEIPKKEEVKENERNTTVYTRPDDTGAEGEIEEIDGSSPASVAD